ncbi:MAG: SH3 domain-containing protein [Lachnospiraceae bacterium]|nr:SH3 domain-containing protein [Lachnospiraceae bacterium]
MKRKKICGQIKRFGGIFLALLLVFGLFAHPVRIANAEETAASSLEDEIDPESSTESIPSSGEESSPDGSSDSTEESTDPSSVEDTSTESSEESSPESSAEESSSESSAEESSTDPSVPSTEESSEDPVVPAEPYTIPYRNYPVESLKESVTLGLIRNASVMNLRTGPDKSYAVIGTVRYGVVLEVLGEKNGWYQVATGYFVGGKEVTGYISGTYVRAGTIAPGASAYQNYLTFLGFPAAYQSYLVSLHAKYPSWIFIANNTGESWSTAIANEVNRPTYPGMSLIHPQMISSWKKSSEGYYDYETSTYAKYDGNWNAASDELVAYFLDPRNFLNETDIFQFLDQRYDPSQTEETVQAIGKNFFLSGTNTWTDVDGTKFTYPKVLVEIGKSIGVSPNYLAAVIRQEVGAAGHTNPSITGTSKKYPGYYNYYNIYAFTTASESANDHGLWFASGSGVGATSYNRPWNTRIKALWGGAQYLADNYVLAGQNTIYYKKYNVSAYAKNHFIHQFMTNVMGAYSEGSHLAEGYDAAMRRQALAFDIPIYSGLPSSPAPCPTGDGCINNRLKSIKVGSYDLFPAFDKDELYYNVIIMDEKATTVTLSAEPYNSTAKIEGTGTITLVSGTTDYTIKVTAQNGDVREYHVSIYCSKEWNCGYKISEQNYLSGLSFGTTTQAFISKLGLTDQMSCKLFDADGTAKKDGTAMKNGDLVKLYDAEGKLFFDGAVLLFGDVNGDGYLRMSDMIKIRNHILETGKLSGVQLASADCNHDTYIRMSDMIKVRNEILGTGTIVQTAK